MRLQVNCVSAAMPMSDCVATIVCLHSSVLLHCSCSVALSSVLLIYTFKMPIFFLKFRICFAINCLAILHDRCSQSLVGILPPNRDPLFNSWMVTVMYFYYAFV